VALFRPERARRTPASPASAAAASRYSPKSGPSRLPLKCPALLIPKYARSLLGWSRLADSRARPALFQPICWSCSLLYIKHGDTVETWLEFEASLGITQSRTFGENEIGGDDDRGLLVEPADQVEQELATGLGERQ
jgi:hypothetical protein